MRNKVMLIYNMINTLARHKDIKAASYEMSQKDGCFEGMVVIVGDYYLVAARRKGA